MTPQDQSNLAAREARQRAERHQAYKEAALVVACIVALLCAVKFIVNGGVF